MGREEEVVGAPLWLRDQEHETTGGRPRGLGRHWRGHQRPQAAQRRTDQRPDIGNTVTTDLAPLRGMALKEFRCFNTKVADLSPLQGMPLEHLQTSGTPVTDLTPLHAMGLLTLALHGCP